MVTEDKLEHAAETVGQMYNFLWRLKDLPFEEWGEMGDVWNQMKSRLLFWLEIPPQLWTLQDESELYLMFRDGISAMGVVGKLIENWAGFNLPSKPGIQ